MLKNVLLVVGVLVVGFLGFVATRPSTYHYERSMTMQAPADVLFPYANDMRQWVTWSPWDKLDPNMEKKFEGAESGVTASYYWKGNDQVGEGRMTITESVDQQKVVYDLQFLKPFESKALTTIAFAPEGDGTKVTWSMDGDNNFMAKMFGVFNDMDKMIGADFEKGLATLKESGEKAAVAKKAEAERLAAEQAAAAAAAQAGAPTADGSAPAVEGAAPAVEGAAPAAANPQGEAPKAQ